MLEQRKIRAGKGYIEAFSLGLGEKNLVVLKGTRGFVMCGYINLSAAKKYKDAAVKITGAATIRDALAARVHSCTPRAQRLGVFRGQSIRQTLRLIV